MPRKKKEEEPKEKKKTIREIMATIIDEEALQKRKEKASKKAVEEEIKPIEEPKPKKWYQLPMEKEKFSTLNYKGSFYVHYSEWSDDVFAGPYKTENECETLISDYIRVSNSKNILDRNIPNIHSVVIKIK